MTDTTILAELRAIIADADIGPPTDSYCCVECGAWTPWKHPEAHDHEDGCTAPARFRARRDWKGRLRVVCASLEGAETHG